MFETLSENSSSGDIFENIENTYSLTETLDLFENELEKLKNKIILSKLIYKHHVCDTYKYFFNEKIISLIDNYHGISIAIFNIKYDIDLLQNTKYVNNNIYKHSNTKYTKTLKQRDISNNNVSLVNTIQNIFVFVFWFFTNFLKSIHLIDYYDSSNQHDAGEHADEDAVEDADEDAGEDAVEDAGEDADEDAGEDADEDADEDAGEDVGEDVGEDADENAVEDADEDAGEDADEDAGEDADEDADEDAGEDADEDADDVSDENVNKDTFYIFKDTEIDNSLNNPNSIYFSNLPTKKEAINNKKFQIDEDFTNYINILGL
jgi:hypothetical protein